MVGMTCTWLTDMHISKGESWWWGSEKYYRQSAVSPQIHQRHAEVWMRKSRSCKDRIIWLKLPRALGIISSNALNVWREQGTPLRTHSWLMTQLGSEIRVPYSSTRADSHKLHGCPHKCPTWCLDSWAYEEEPQVPERCSLGGASNSPLGENGPPLPSHHTLSTELHHGYCAKTWLWVFLLLLRTDSDSDLKLSRRLRNVSVGAIK